MSKYFRHTKEEAVEYELFLKSIEDLAERLINEVLNLLYFEEFIKIRLSLPLAEVLTIDRKLPSSYYT